MYLWYVVCGFSMHIHQVVVRKCYERQQGSYLWALQCTLIISHERINSMHHGYTFGGISSANCLPKAWQYSTIYYVWCEGHRSEILNLGVKQNLSLIMKIKWKYYFINDSIYFIINRHTKSVLLKKSKQKCPWTRKNSSVCIINNISLTD